jgi:1-acyl-sn-glycerol-3-phosphate acyltransferase
MWLPLTILFPTKILHRERFPKGKCIATSNHYSNLDALLYDLKFVKKFRFMAKSELFKNKFNAFILKRFGAYPVDRQNVSPSVFKKTLTELKQNHQVFIFPEGTRNKKETEEMQSVKQGIITFASKGDAEIVPMLIYQKAKVFRKNYIIVGEPFKVEGQNPARLTKEETENNLKIYTEKMNALRVELDEFVQSKHKKKK